MPTARSSRGSALGRSPWRRASRPEPPRGKHQAPGVRDCLSNPEPFFPEGPALGERAQLGMAPGEVGTGEHGGQEELTEALVAPHPLQGRYGLPEAVDRPTIVALGLVGMPRRKLASACRTTSPLALASARARWAAAIAWSYAPMK